MTMYRIISDIHCEFWSENPRKAARMIDQLLPALPDDAATTLLLAGNTGSHKRRNIYAAVIDHLCNRFKLVLDISGNHYWYGGSDWNWAPAPTSQPNYVLGSTFTDGQVVAATLWADFQRGNPMVELACVEGMNDFRQIKGITVQGVKDRYAEHVAFLKENIRPGSVVMTHFAPSWRSVPPDFQTDIRNGYYVSELEQLILDRRPALWVHGHIHTACDYRIGDTRVVCNPAGYSGRDHDPILMIEATVVRSTQAGFETGSG